MTRTHARAERGAALLLAMVFVLVLAVAGVAVLRIAGRDRIDAAKMSVRDRGIACAEAGLQYGRRLFGCTYRFSDNWNAYLSGAVAGARFDPQHLSDAHPDDIEDIPLAFRGDFNNDGKLDAGTDLDGDGMSDFWVSIHDDDDERPSGTADDRRRDNNMTVILRAECTNSGYAMEVGSAQEAAVVETVLTYLPGLSGYGTAPSASNQFEAAAGGAWTHPSLGPCE